MDLDNVNKNWDGLIIDLLIFQRLTSGGKLFFQLTGWLVHILKFFAN